MGRGRFRGGQYRWRTRYRPQQLLASGYEYGWPSGGTEEPNVAAQWILDEASGNIVDEVNSISLGLFQSGTQTTTYEVPATGDWALLSPGIKSEGTSGGFMCFRAAANSAVDLGTSDFVAETVMQLDTQTGIAAVYQDATTAAGSPGWYWNYRATSDSNCEIFFRADSLSFVGGVKTYTGASLPIDSEFHKFRLTGDRDGNCVVYIDGVEALSFDISSLNGETISSRRISLMGRFNTANPLRGTMLEFRLTIGNATNNSKGPGGG